MSHQLAFIFIALLVSESTSADVPKKRPVVVDSAPVKLASLSASTREALAGVKIEVTNNGAKAMKGKRLLRLGPKRFAVADANVNLDAVKVPIGGMLEFEQDGKFVLMVCSRAKCMECGFNVDTESGDVVCEWCGETCTVHKHEGSS